MPSQAAGARDTQCRASQASDAFHLELAARSSFLAKAETASMLRNGRGAIAPDEEQPVEQNSSACSAALNDAGEGQAAEPVTP